MITCHAYYIFLGNKEPEKPTDEENTDLKDLVDKISEQLGETNIKLQPRLKSL